jgi:hypothetical protein
LPEEERENGISINLSAANGKYSDLPEIGTSTNKKRRSGRENLICGEIPSTQSRSRAVFYVIDRPVQMKDLLNRRYEEPSTTLLFIKRRTNAMNPRSCLALLYHWRK